ncbi:ROK family glucokinase [Priestia megaterium]|uniref:ROK family glucokinase n=1 Tax=Priestia megaterium TaxID=1404 RepID=UPI00366B4AF6
MYEKWLVGVDIGGTTIKVAFLNQNGEIIKKWKIDTNKNHAIPTDIARSIEQELYHVGETKKKLIGIGVGAPGPINLTNGTVDIAVNLGWENYPLKNYLEMETSLPVIVENDANIAAIGEMWKGAGQGVKDLICVTLGTGVGGGIISDGEIIHGTNGSGGEIGHITSIVDGGAPCNCGRTGCLETIASATGIVNLTLKELASTNTESPIRTTYNAGEKISSKLVFDQANRGDKLAKRVINKVCFHLGFALASLSNGLNPERVVIGGGVSESKDVLLVPLKEHYYRFLFPRVAQGVELSIATLGNDAGIIGGAWLVKNKLT